MSDVVERSWCPRCHQPLPVTQTNSRSGEQLALDRITCRNCGAALVRDIEGHIDRGWRLDESPRPYETD